MVPLPAVALSSNFCGALEQIEDFLGDLQARVIARLDPP
jgi:hypothetical protein